MEIIQSENKRQATILPVQIIGSPVLRKKALDIDKNYKDLPEFIENMWATMYDSDGVGLAAPQVGKSIRLFVIDAEAMSEDEPELADFKHVFINAKILETWGDTYLFNEGCLSIPELREDVEEKKISKCSITTKIGFFTKMFSEVHKLELFNTNTTIWKAFCSPTDFRHCEKHF